jgi:hypothetical protein
LMRNNNKYGRNKVCNRFIITNIDNIITSSIQEHNMIAGYTHHHSNSIHAHASSGIHIHKQKGANNSRHTHTT